MTAVQYSLMVDRHGLPFWDEEPGDIEGPEGKGPIVNARLVAEGEWQITDVERMLDRVTAVETVLSRFDARGETGRPTEEIWSMPASAVWPFHFEPVVGKPAAVFTARYWKENGAGLEMRARAGVEEAFRRYEEARIASGKWDMKREEEPKIGGSGDSASDQ